MNQTREIYLDAAEAALSLRENENTSIRWDQESVLGGMIVGVLPSHLARSILQVGRFLDGELTGLQSPVSATTYYTRLTDTSSRFSALNTGIEERSADTAARGPAAAADTGAALKDLEERLGTEPADRRVAVAHRPGEELHLDEFLRTRLVELAVHTDGLALSVDVECAAPPRAIAAAIDYLSKQHEHATETSPCSTHYPAENATTFKHSEC